MDSVKGRVYTVTGCAGIGLAVAKLLLSKGALVALADIDQGALDSAVQTLTTSTPAAADSIMTTKLDVGDRCQVDAWIEATVTRFGRLDGCANMAGAIGKHHGTRNVWELEDDQWDFIMRVNLTGAMYCMRAQMRYMINSTTESSGSIVNATSIQGSRGFAKHAAYSASKHGVIGLTRSAAKEAAPRIRVNAVAPGTIQTPLLEIAKGIQGDMGKFEHAFPRIGEADEVAQTVVFLLSDAASYITGSISSVDGGWDC